MAQLRAALQEHHRHMKFRFAILFLVPLVTAVNIFACGQALPPAPTTSRIVIEARKQVGVTTGYDPSYTTLAYPGGDVPIQTGVCCDVVIRALRPLGMDMQKLVHEDMVKNFGAYPHQWNLKSPDKNIDHRRVPNLRKYFERRKWSVTGNLKDPRTYLAGDIVTWDLFGGYTHIGIVTEKSVGKGPLVIHNIGSGAKEEDVLFSYTITGHYRAKITSKLENKTNFHY